MFAVIAAGGSGSRMELADDRNKAFLPLTPDLSIFQCSVNAVVSAGVCKGVCIVTREQDIALARDQAAPVSGGLPVTVVSGGATRAESVRNAVDTLRGKADYVLIHDAARPLCAPDLIRALAERVRSRHAALLAVPVRATLKRSEDDEEVLWTVPRDGMWEAQTPQGFQLELLFSAYEHSGDRALDATDESQLVEAVEHPVALVMGSPRNIKITTPEDLAIARALMAMTRDASANTPE